MILRDPPVWNKDAAVLLKQFLETPVGQLFLAQLAHRRPPLVSGVGDVNLVALRAEHVAGYEGAISNVVSLAEPPVTADAVTQELYPPLDDEAAWKKT